MKANRGAGDVNGAASLREPRPRAREATVRVIERHASQVMRTARRYAATPEDAEDAYQRGIEIMLTKAPDIPDAELLPWLKTVVRHEAFALRRKDERIALGARAGDGDVLDGGDFVSLSPTPVEQVERFERLRLGAEALQGLKPQEAQALTLLAQGYSYSQIREETGWTYTKVNRCLAEGRQTFVKRVAGIESGAECERLAPKLSAFADGEAPAADVTLIRRHLRGCLACKASLRELHLAPAAVGALVPLPFLEQMGWWVHRISDRGSVLRLKFTSTFRSSPLDLGSNAGNLGLEGGARELVSAGVVKALAILCVSGAGGAAVIERSLNPVGPDSARASVEVAPSVGRQHSRSGSPSPELVRERLRQPNGQGQIDRFPSANSAESRPGERSRLRRDPAIGSAREPRDDLPPSGSAVGPVDGAEPSASDPGDGGRPTASGQEAEETHADPAGNGYDDPYVDPRDHPGY